MDDIYISQTVSELLSNYRLPRPNGQRRLPPPRPAPSARGPLAVRSDLYYQQISQHATPPRPAPPSAAAEVFNRITTSPLHSCSYAYHFPQHMSARRTL